MFRVQIVLDKVSKMTETNEIYFDLIGEKNKTNVLELHQKADIIIKQIKKIKSNLKDNVELSLNNMKIIFDRDFDSFLSNIIKYNSGENKDSSTIEKKYLASELENKKENYILTFGKKPNHFMNDKDKSYVSPQKLEKRLTETTKESSILSSESTINILNSTKTNGDNTLINLMNINMFNYEENDLNDDIKSFCNTSNDSLSLSKIKLFKKKGIIK